jgi:hypothetical protein
MTRRIAVLLLLAGCTGPSATPTDSTGLRLARTQTPSFLHPAFRQLDSVLTSGQRDTLKRLVPDSAWQYHFGLGLYIRNEMGLWRGAPLAESLSVRGVKHPDDMSGIILDTYAQYLRGETVDVQGAITSAPKPPEGFKVLSAPIKVP